MQSEAEQIQQKIYMKMTPAQKWEEFLRLRQAALELKKAGLRMQHPDQSPEQIEEAVKKIFLYATT